MQLAVQFRIAAGKAVGIFRQTMALGTLLRYQTKIGRVKPYFMSDISLEKAFSFRWADLSLKGVINNLFNEEYQSVLSRPMPRLNYEIFLDIRPKWGKRNKKQ